MPSWRTVAPTDSHQIQRSSKPGIRERRTAGIATMTMRVNDAIERGHGVAHRLKHAAVHEDDARTHKAPPHNPQILRSDRDDRGVGREEPDHGFVGETAGDCEDERHSGRHHRGALERFEHPVGLSRAEILAGHWRHGKAKRDDRHEARLNQALADSEAGLGRRAERPADRVHDEEIHGDECELDTRRQPNLQDLPPHPAMRFELRTQLQVRLHVEEVEREPDRTDDDGDK